MTAHPYTGGCHCGNIARAIPDIQGLGPETPVSPKTLSAQAKSERWKGIWFSDVTLRVA